MAEQGFAVRRQHHLVRIPGQQLPANHGLQLADVLADGGLSEPQPLGREGKASHLLDGDEAAQLDQVEH